MNIYIPEFLLGVLAVIVVEVAWLLAYSFVAFKKGKGKDDETT